MDNLIKCISTKTSLSRPVYRPKQVSINDLNEIVRDDCTRSALENSNKDYAGIGTISMWISDTLEDLADKDVLLIYGRMITDNIDDDNLDVVLEAIECDFYIVEYPNDFEEFNTTGVVCTEGDYWFIAYYYYIIDSTAISIDYINPFSTEYIWYNKIADIESACIEERASDISTLNAMMNSERILFLHEFVNYTTHRDLYHLEMGRNVSIRRYSKYDIKPGLMERKYILAVAEEFEAEMTLHDDFDGANAYPIPKTLSFWMIQSEYLKIQRNEKIDNTVIIEDNKYRSLGKGIRKVKFLTIYGFFYIS